MRIGLANAPVPTSLDDAVQNSLGFIVQAASVGVDILCFPEAYLPGVRGRYFHVPLCEQEELRQALATVRTAAALNGIGVIMPMEWPTENGLLNLAHVISPEGALLGRQCKVQLNPNEEDIYIPGRGRQIFELGGVIFGVVLSHEGWRYPETVRWAAIRGAQIVFHPTFAGHDTPPSQSKTWGDPDGPYYEKAMSCRSIENTIFFASVNYALPCQDAATSLIAPDGTCLAHHPYGVAGLLVHKLDLEEATNLLARRFTPERY